MRKLVPIIILAAALAVGIQLGMRTTSEPLGPAVRIDFIDVGQGDSIFIRTPDGINLLIDAGEEKYGPKVVEHLSRLGVKRLDLVVMSHPHSDHIGGMPAVFEAFPVAGVLDSGYAHGTNVQEQVLRMIQDKKIPYHRATAGMRFRYGEKFTLEVLAPAKKLIEGTDSDANNNSVVVRLTYGQKRILFTGDIGREGEGRLIASRRDMESNVLKVAHHGSGSSTSLEFIRLVKPEYVIISVGAGNEYGHPGKSLLKRLAEEKTGALMFRTDRNGTITVRTDGHKIVVESER